MKFITAFDRLIAHRIGQLPQRWIRLADWIGYVTSPPVWIGVLGINWFVNPSWAGCLIILLVPFGGISKLVFRRRRPPTMYARNMKIKSYSFPSSHAYCAALGGGWLGYLSIIAGWWLVSLGLLGLITVIGISRIYLGAHYPSDIVAGWLLGGSSVAMIGLLL